jgi:DNA-binding CsgD family transcriptional regulator
MAPKSALLGKEAEVIKLYESGQSCIGVAKQYKASELTVKKILLKNGVVLNRQKSSERAIYVVQAYQNGKSLTATGDEFGLSAIAVLKILAKHGIEPRSKSRQLKEKMLRQGEEIIEAYRQGKNQNEICTTYRIGRLALLSLLEKAGCKKRHHGDNIRRYAVDHSYFDNIDSEQKAYFLGYMFADGYNNEQEGYFLLTLHPKDVEVLTSFKNALQTEAPVRVKQRERSPYCKLLVHSKRLSERLAELGCVQAKTFKITFPNWLNPNLYNHFVRGYFDGDGSISDVNRAKFKSFIDILGTTSFISTLADIVSKLCNVRTKIIAHPRSLGIERVNVRGNNQVKRVVSWLYQDATVFLSRKKQRADAILSTNFVRARGKATKRAVTKSMAQEIKNLLSVELSDRIIAERFDISTHVVYQIRTGRSWARVL